MTLEEPPSARRLPSFLTWLGLTGLAVMLLGSLLVWVWGGDCRLVTAAVVAGFVILIPAAALAERDRGDRHD